ncbi:MAG: alpha-hydroxy-acid oxidizing protein, partial [Burkholderiales bacterium]
MSKVRLVYAAQLVRGSSQYNSNPAGGNRNMTDPTLGAYDIADLRELARRRLPKGVFEFFDRGNGDEVAVANNRAAIELVKFNPHMLVDTSRRSLATTLYGKPQAMPLVVGPTGSA